MPAVLRSILYLLIVSWSLGCQRIDEIPSDYRKKGLDPKTALLEAEIVVVLAYPTSQRNIGRELHFREAGRTELVRIQETETTLAAIQVFKGVVPGNEIRFRHFKAGSGYIQVGPPQGPSGGLGVTGIFFLRNRQSGGFRSAVDLYRPDIEAPWIKRSWDKLQCSDPADCIMQTLLHFRDRYDGTSFAGWLGDNTALAHYMVGHLKTLELLSDLVTTSTPESVKRSACHELSKWYPLEFPGRCRPFIAGTQAEQEYLDRLAKAQKKLEESGLRYLRDELQSKDESDLMLELEFLKSSDDSEVRRLAHTLRNSSRKKE